MNILGLQYEIATSKSLTDKVSVKILILFFLQDTCMATLKLFILQNIQNFKVDLATLASCLKWSPPYCSSFERNFLL